MTSQENGPSYQLSTASPIPWIHCNRTLRMSENFSSKVNPRWRARVAMSSPSKFDGYPKKAMMEFIDVYSPLEVDLTNATLVS